MRKKVLILGGGYSKERSISLRSTKAIIKAINKIYKIKFCDPCHDLFKTIENFEPDIIFNGLVDLAKMATFSQFLETLGIKYTTFWCNFINVCHG